MKLERLLGPWAVAVACVFMVGSTAAAQASRTPGVRPPDPLSVKVTVHFVDAPLSEALAYLSRARSRTLRYGMRWTPCYGRRD